MIKIEVHKDWHFFVLENDDVTWKPRIVIFKYQLKIWKVAHKMAVKFFQNSHRALNLHKFCLCPRNISLVFFRTLNWLLIVIVINVVIGGFSGENLKWLTHETVWLQVSDYTVQLQLCRLISAKYSNLCNNHIWQNCNCYDLCVN